jgi:hypothetical protein
MDPFKYLVVRGCGLEVFLIFDVGMVVIMLLFLVGRKLGKIDNAVKAPLTWREVLIVTHLVLSGITLWFDNYYAYQILTLVLWGPIIGSFVVREVRKGLLARKESQTPRGANEEKEMTDSQETIFEQKPPHENESMDEQGQDAIG